MEEVSNGGKMFVKYNPYTVETTVRFDATDESGGDEPKVGSPLRQSYEGKRLQEWIDKLPELLKSRATYDSYEIIFHGTTLDYEDIKAVADSNPDVITVCKHIQGSEPEDKLIKLKEIFNRAKELEFKALDEYNKLIDDAFNRGFEVYIVATMSAGKSTLINAFLKKKLMPAAARATTAVISRIEDTGEDSNNFYVRAYKEGEYEAGEECYSEEIKNAEYEDVERINKVLDENAPKQLFSRRGIDKDITEEFSPPMYPNVVIKGNIPFVDNKGMSLVIVDTPGTNSQLNPLHKEITYKAIQKGPEALILFVMNAANSGVTDEAVLLRKIGEVMNENGKMSRDRFMFVVNKLDDYDSEPDNIKVKLEEIRDDLKKTYSIHDARIYPASAEVALGARTKWENPKKKANAEMMVQTEQMHLENSCDGINSHIPVSDRIKIKQDLVAAQKNGVFEEQALIHSGIPSIEAAIREYIEKYAKTLRIGDVAKKLSESLNTGERTAALHSEIMCDEEKRKSVMADIESVRKAIASGERGKKYEQRLEVEMRATLESVRESIKNIVDNTSDGVVDYAKTLMKGKISLSEANVIYDDWQKYLSDKENELKADLSDAFDKGLKNSVTQFLNELKNSIKHIMTEGEVGNLSSLDLSVLLGAELNVDVAINNFKQTEKISIGTRRQKNPEREGFFGFFKFWEPWTISKPVYSNVEYINTTDYFEDVIGEMRKELDKVCKKAVAVAENSSKKMAKEFKDKFARLGDRLAMKSKELEELCIQDDDLQNRIDKKNDLHRNIEQLQKELDVILEV